MYLIKSGSSSSTPGRGLNNPAFSIKIIPPNDDIQQDRSAGRNNPSSDLLDDISVGDKIVTKIEGKEIDLKVSRVIKNELKDGVYVIATDSEGKEHKVETSRIRKTRKETVSDAEDRLQSSPALFNESKFLSFNEFTHE